MATEKTSKAAESTPMLTVQDYEVMADTGRTGTEGLDRDEAKAVLVVRFRKAAQAYEDRQGGEQWRKLMEATAALQNWRNDR